ncbi:MAG: toprim domain-containing protein [Magnetococcales bacterium]|nr:toprim domain-containing protein [Magnetococcales bacterium]
MNDITDIKRALASSVQRVAEYLLPQGKREGHEWEVGSISGEPGKSLKVHLTGSKAGLWMDFQTGQKGDLIDLWQAVKNETLTQSLADIRKWLGMKEPELVNRPRQYSRPKTPGTPVRQDTPVDDYLTKQRKISPEAIDAYRVGFQDRNMVFPSYRNGELIFVKRIGIDRTPEGKKVVSVEANCEPCLFGWQAISDNARSVTICEGEIDALTLYGKGFPALSVPFGGGTGAKHAWVETEYPHLERFETIYLCFDQDETGQKAVVELVERLGRHRCRVVDLPAKDPNEWHLRGGTFSDFAAAFVAARSIDPPTLRNADDFLAEVLDLFYPPGGVEPGMPTAWNKIGNRLRFRPGELTVWTGNTGCGKSQALGQSIVQWVMRGGRCLLASLEMRSARSLERMVRQMTGMAYPPKPYIEAAMDRLSEGLWIYDLVGKAEVKELLQVCDYARRRYGVEIFVIDSLMRLGVSTEDYTGQEAAMLEMVSFAVSRNVHIHLVAHSRKNRMEGIPSPGAQIKGSSAIGDNAFNVIEVTRNFAKEKKLAGGATPESIQEEHDGGLVVQKQRNGTWTGQVRLWFDSASQQYLEGWAHKPTPMFEWSGHVQDF